MKRFNLILLSVVLIAAMMLVSACGGGGSQQQQQAASDKKADAAKTATTLRMGHLAPETSPYHVLAKKFKATVEQKTNGAYKVDLYPAGQIGKDRELLEAMQFGNVDMGVITTSPMVNFVPEMSVLDLPYVFKNWDHVEKFLSSTVAADLLKESQKAKLVSLGFLPRGFRHVTNSKHPIAKPGDFSDIKLRVIESPVYVETFKSMGASAQAMSWGEVFTALQQKTIDGQENATNTIFDERVYEVQKYVSETGHMFAFASIVISKATWDKFPADVQKIMADAAAEACKEVGKAQREEESLYKKKLEEKGMVFNAVDREGFKKMVQPVYDKFGNKYLKPIEAL